MVRFPKSLDSTESVRPDRLAIRRLLVSAAIFVMIACNSVYAQTVPWHMVSSPWQLRVRQASALLRQL